MIQIIIREYRTRREFMLGIIIDSISTFMYSKLLVILLIGAGIYFTIRTKLPQMRLFKDACKAVVEKPEDENGVSSFQALMVSTASRVGTGNIIGVSSAICIGGFGSVFWMWIIAIIGSASALIESTLAQIYKRKGKDGECYGGPAYYIEAALHCRPLAIIFCISMIATYAFGFNMLASYNLQSTFSGFSFYDVKWTPWIIGGILAVITGWCLLGGGSRIVKVTSTLVPAMMCLSSGIAPAQELQGAPWVQAALHESLGNFGPLFITVAMVLFAFTTLLGNCFYCDNLLNYIHKGQPSKTFMKGFRIVSALVVFIGAGMEVSMLWNISDVLMGVMALINIPVILILSNTALKALEDYEKQKKNGENPVFKTGNIGLEYETDYWS